MQPGYGWQPPQPPKKTGVGCLGWVLIAVVAFLATTVVVCSAVLTPKSETSQAKAQREAKLAEERDATAAEEARARAQNAEANRKLAIACKLPPDAEAVEVPTVEKILDHCHGAIRLSAKVPGSIEFPSEPEDTIKLTSDNGCNYIYTSWFDGQNAFGVKVRTRYRCTFDPITTMPSIKTLN